MEPFAVSIEEAARMVGISRNSFYEDYLTPGRIRPIPRGARRLIDVDELRSAWKLYAASTRDPRPLMPPSQTSRGSKTG